MTRDQRAKRGRRGGPSVTRAAILAAARRGFAERGYEGTSLRAIALAADVDVTLVLYFFEGKERLFRTLLRQEARPYRRLVELLRRGDRDKLGAGLVTEVMNAWEDDESAELLRVLLLGAVGSPETAQVAREVVTEDLLRPLADLIGGPDATFQANVVGSELVGLALTRYVLRFEPLAGADRQTVINAVAPTLQAHVDQAQ